MRTKSWRRTTAAGAALLLTAALAACSSGASSDSSSGTAGTVTISVGNLPSAQSADDRKYYLSLVDDFEKANPTIKLEPQEVSFDATTFQTMLAGGTMPTTMEVPFTEGGSLMDKQQVAKLTDYVQGNAGIEAINPALKSFAQDSAGDTYGVPVAAYTMGLIYNRDLFTQAGLDPDNPPTTWDQVAADAKAITASTGKQGFMTMSKDNLGGWILTAMSAAFGSRVQSTDGRTATVDNSSTAAVLKLYQQMRWTDDAMGSNFLLGFDDVVQAFAAGNVGMWVMGGTDAYYNAVIYNGMDKDKFGLAPLPQTSTGLGALGGGALAVVNPKATPAQISAALKWIEFRNLRQYTSQDQAVADAKAKLAENQPVGVPTLPLVDATAYAQYLGWIKDYINVPRDHFQKYIDTVSTLPVVTEPATSAQETYSALDPVVQAVLTQQDASVDSLLADAQKTAQSAIDAG